MVLEYIKSMKSNCMDGGDDYAQKFFLSSYPSSYHLSRTNNNRPKLLVAGGGYNLFITTKIRLSRRTEWMGIWKTKSEGKCYAVAQFVEALRCKTEGRVVIGIFYWLNPSGSTMGLELT